MKREIERRAYSADWHLSAGTVEGYAALYETPSIDLGGFREVIRRGAFERALRGNADVRALINHDPSLLLGRTRAGTLTLDDDERGLRATIMLPDTSYARDLVELLKRGDISQMSFAFRVRREQWSRDNTLREVIDVDLYDVSIVTYPAYEETSAQLRASRIAGGSPVSIYRFRLRLVEMNK